MSTQAEVAKLLDDAGLALRGIEGLAVSERNRVEEGLAHARSAVASMQVNEPKPEPVEAAQEPAEEAPVEPVEGSAVPEVPAGTGAQGASTVSPSVAADTPEPVAEPAPSEPAESEEPGA